MSGHLFAIFVISEFHKFQSIAFVKRKHSCKQYSICTSKPIRWSIFCIFFLSFVVRNGQNKTLTSRERIRALLRILFHFFFFANWQFFFCVSHLIIHSPQAVTFSFGFHFRFLFCCCYLNATVCCSFESI